MFSTFLETAEFNVIKYTFLMAHMYSRLWQLFILLFTSFNQLNLMAITKRRKKNFSIV